jgi:hypothetical protein
MNRERLENKLLPYITNPYSMNIDDLRWAYAKYQVKIISKKKKWTEEDLMTLGYKKHSIIDWKQRRVKYQEKPYFTNL